MEEKDSDLNFEVLENKIKEFTKFTINAKSILDNICKYNSDINNRIAMSEEMPLSEEEKEGIEKVYNTNLNTIKEMAYAFSDLYKTLIKFKSPAKKDALTEMVEELKEYQKKKK